MEKNRFLSLFDLLFRYPDNTDYPVSQIDRIQNRLRSGQWSSKKVLSEFDTLYRELTDAERSHINDIRKDLNELRSKEKRQRKQLRSDLETATQDVPLHSIYQQNEFIETWLARKNQNTREALTEDLVEGMEDVRIEIESAEYDIQDLKQAFEYGIEEEVVQELQRLYPAFILKGWHRRDLQNLHPYNYENEYFEYIETKLHQEPTENTFVFFLPNFEPENRIEPDDFVELIAPSGEFSIDTLAEIYPYDGEETEHVDPDLPELLENDALVKLRVKAYVAYGANEIAFEKLGTFLDALSYANSLSDIEAPQYRDKLKYIRWSESAHEMSKSTGMIRETSERIVFPDQISSRLVDDALPTLTDDSPLVEYYSRGIHLYRKGNTGSRNIDKIIYYAACLETIASTDTASRDEKIENLITVGKLWDTDETRDILDSVFEARNDALHAGLEQSNLDAEVDAMRHSLKTALYELSQCIQDSEPRTIPEFIGYVDDRLSEEHKQQVEDLEQVGIELNSTYPFETGTFTRKDHNDQEVEVRFSGKMTFNYSNERLVPEMKFEEVEKEGDGRFPAPHAPSFDIEVEDATLEVGLYRIPNSVSAAVTRDSFHHVAPWTTKPPRVEVNDPA
jgi:hypothetical protein